MVALGIHQSIHTTPSVDSRVLTAIKLLVLACEDASRVDFGVEKNFLAIVSTREVKITSLIKWTTTSSFLCVNPHKEVAQ